MIEVSRYDYQEAIDAAETLVKLLKCPQPGLFTWNMAVCAFRDRLLEGLAANEKK